PEVLNSTWPRTCIQFGKMQLTTPETDEVDLAIPRPPLHSRIADACRRFCHRGDVRICAAVMLCITLLCAGVFFYFYVKLAHIIDRRLAAGPFSHTTNIFSSPVRVGTGDALTLEEFTAELRKSGYSDARDNPEGWFAVRSHAVEVTPGPDSASSSGPALIEFSKDAVARIQSPDRRELPEFDLGPQLVANLSGKRERRRLVKFTDLPPELVNALVAVEDKRFFRHSGFDLPRIFKAASVDLRSGRKDQGASTLTMQLARGFWLEPGKRWKRKIEELAMTLHMERRLSKQQIFEYYANQVYLGRRDTFSISGFAEGARTYFNKDLSQLDTSEAAFLAGLVQRPSYYNPYRYPDRARDRRDIVLRLMRRNGYLSDSQYESALHTPLRFASERAGAHQNQYFLDLVRDELHNHLDENGNEGRNIYTTLDPDLQDAAEAAVRLGMEKVDHLLRAKKMGAEAGQPQVALIALDPRTGEVKALIGGRDYGTSQLNHIVAMRQPGSVFKPFVYAAALNTALEGGSAIFTPASLLDDSPQTFYSGRQSYQPGNFHHEFMGEVTLRTALAHSLNVATVSLASQVGYGKVVQMARRSGLNDAIKPTPSVALGSYETTPLEIARAYTTFANQGVNVQPTMLAEVRGADGRVIYHRSPQTHTALDPRINYLMVSLMQEVLRSGTGAGVRSLGFTLPAAGKTGTSRDGWFAGFTSELLCVVWVGFDDNRELNLEGARSALPIWAEFMKRAAKHNPYRKAKAFATPAGIVSVSVCADSGELACPFCPNVRTDFFADGSQPQTQCARHDARIADDPAPSVRTDR
ncbi:MAG: penicillin-binding protein family, partial [Candidatus Solibacter sp.]|nr:penicillin-binding protein family [Candidatus Solibacter sp.]